MSGRGKGGLDNVSWFHLHNGWSADFNTTTTEGLTTKQG
jgi:hypothetical protein